jgi:hypothetical protein
MPEENEAIVTRVEIEPDVQEDIKEKQLIPTGTNIQVEISALPKVKDSKSTPGGRYISIPLAVIGPAEFAGGEWLYHMVTIPSKAYRAKCAAKAACSKGATDEEISIKVSEYATVQTKDIPESMGYKSLCSGFFTFTKVAGQDKDSLDLQALVGLKFNCTVGFSDFGGTPRNQIQGALQPYQEINPPMPLSD